jgi:AbrB family looped-hinge helix DNA binding protein
LKTATVIATDSARFSAFLEKHGDRRVNRLNFSFHFSMTHGIMNAMKTETIQMDKAGRVVLPKPLRDQFNLLPGDKLRLSVEGNGFRLEPADGGGELARKGSVLVFTGGFAEPITTAKVNELIQLEREGRITAQIGRLRKK